MKGNMIVDKIKKEMQQMADPQKAKILAGFFKTKKGEYGEGDKFLGIVVPKQRLVTKKYHRIISLSDLEKFIKSPFHEHRLTALLILTYKFPKANASEQKQIFGFYLKHTKQINNWDLVDLSAPNIVGAYLKGKNHKILYKLAKSNNLWERRIAIIATAAFIRLNQLSDTFKISEILLADDHDLIHKAVGWMLREAGKRDLPALKKFLKKHGAKMPRTMLRYAIEKFPEKERKQYLNAASPQKNFKRNRP